jgi:hypothetical protein
MVNLIQTNFITYNKMESKIELQVDHRVLSNFFFFGVI